MTIDLDGSIALDDDDDESAETDDATNARAFLFLFCLFSFWLRCLFWLVLVRFAAFVLVSLFLCVFFRPCFLVIFAA